MKKKNYSVPEFEVLYLEDDIITASGGYTEKEEWTGDEVGDGFFG